MTHEVFLSSGASAATAGVAGTHKRATVLQVNEEQWSGAIPAADWVQMITTHPARALAVDNLIGSLQPVRKADITVVRQRGPEPGTSLLANRLADVEMVWIGGQLQYGTASVVQAVRLDVCDNVIVQGSAKRLCTPVLPLVTNLGKEFPFLVPVVR